MHSSCGIGARDKPGTYILISIPRYILGLPPLFHDAHSSSSSRSQSRKGIRTPNDLAVLGTTYSKFVVYVSYKYISRNNINVLYTLSMFHMLGTTGCIEFLLHSKFQDHVYRVHLALFVGLLYVIVRRNRAFCWFGGRFGITPGSLSWGYNGRPWMTPDTGVGSNSTLNIVSIAHRAVGRRCPPCRMRDV